MEKKVLIVKYGEIAMRGNNRKLFVTRLLNAIRKNLEDIGDFYIVREQGRLIVLDMGKEMDYDAVIPRVLRVMGILGVCPGIETDEKNIGALKEASLLYMQKHYPGEKPFKFKVETKRSDKAFPMTSNEVSYEIGGYILENMPHLGVDVHNPEVTLFVEIRTSCYIYSKFIKGFGGLPVGSSGKGTALISGGIDSPVAIFLMAKRGVLVEGVYFHSPPYTSERAKEKVIDLSKQLSLYMGGFKLSVIPFTKLQLYLFDNVPHDKLTIFLKRAMTKTAEKIALKNYSQALITGDSVGQVASQTMHGLNAISSAATMPILRPLCGFDKQEIVDLARKIGTFDISIRPYEDCCTVFVAKHPETRPKKAVVEKIEASLSGLNALIDEALEGREELFF
ncbi:MAG: tRNA uracil 4-sulfurtransferase ThiI [Lachnospiraceae bacterium]|nr:tRNA uracil 4-sulfurtransferase ThiI [Lachnospiraceae bacterium]